MFLRKKKYDEMIEKVAAECRLKNGLSMGSSNQISKVKLTIDLFITIAITKRLFEFIQTWILIKRFYLIKDHFTQSFEC